MRRTRQAAIVHAMYELTTEYIGRPIGWGKPERQSFRTDAAFSDALSQWENLRDKVPTKGTKSTYLPRNTAAEILVILGSVPPGARLHGGEVKQHLREQIAPLIARYPKQSRESILTTTATICRWSPVGLTVSAINRMYREHHRRLGISG